MIFFFSFFKKHAACRKNTHINPHTLKSRLHHFSDLSGWSRWGRRASFPCRECVLLGVVLPYVSFVPLGAGSVVIPSSPPPPPCEEHLATMTITCCITAASHTHVQPKHQPHVYASASKPCSRFRLRYCAVWGQPRSFKRVPGVVEGDWGVLSKIRHNLISPRFKSQRIIQCLDWLFLSLVSF